MLRITLLYTEDNIMLEIRMNDETQHPLCK